MMNMHFGEEKKNMLSNGYSNLMRRKKGTKKKKDSSFAYFYRMKQLFWGKIVLKNDLHKKDCATQFRSCTLMYI